MTQLPIRTAEERSIARSTKRSLHGQQDSPKQHRRILIIGDSITHGGEGDYTWRYRLWQWCKQEGLLAAEEEEASDHESQLGNPATTPKNISPKVSVSFVGPYTGVNPRPSLVAPHPVPLPDDQSPDDPYCPPNRIPWGYARDVDASFATGCRHFATWGYQAHQCMQSIAKVVEDWSPDLIISLLGFNDIGWCVSDAEGTLQAIQGIVRSARIAKERVQSERRRRGANGGDGVQDEGEEERLDFVIGNIVNRTLLEGREDLIENTRKFNSLLLDRAHSWDQHNSKVVVADVAALYDCGPQYRDWAPAAYDGLHPSALGEFQIAKAFTETLHEEFGWGSKGLEIPSSSHHGGGGGVPKRNLQVPEGITAKSTPMGIQVLWKDVFGAAYQVHWREFSSYSLSSSFSSSSSSRGKPELVNNNNDWTLSESSHPQIFLPVPQHCTIEFQLRCHHGFETGPWSPIYKAKCVDAPIPAPTNIQTFPNSIGFEVRWDAPSLSCSSSSTNNTTIKNNGSITRYEVLYKCPTRGDVFPTIVAVPGDQTCADIVVKDFLPAAARAFEGNARDNIDGGNRFVGIVEPIMVRGWIFNRGDDDSSFSHASPSYGNDNGNKTHHGWWCSGLWGNAPPVRVGVDDGTETGRLLLSSSQQAAMQMQMHHPSGTLQPKPKRPLNLHVVYISERGDNLLLKWNDGDEEEDHRKRRPDDNEDKDTDPDSPGYRIYLRKLSPSSSSPPSPLTTKAEPNGMFIKQKWKQVKMPTPGACVWDYEFWVSKVSKVVELDRWERLREMKGTYVGGVLGGGVGGGGGGATDGGKKGNSHWEWELESERSAGVIPEVNGVMGSFE